MSIPELTVHCSFLVFVWLSNCIAEDVTAENRSLVVGLGDELSPL